MRTAEGKVPCAARSRVVGCRSAARRVSRAPAAVRPNPLPVRFRSKPRIRSSVDHGPSPAEQDAATPLHRSGPICVSGRDHRNERSHPSAGCLPRATAACGSKPSEACRPRGSRWSLPRGLTWANPSGSTLPTKHTFAGKAVSMCVCKIFGTFAIKLPRVSPGNCSRERCAVGGPPCRAPVARPQHNRPGR